MTRLVAAAAAGLTLMSACGFPEAGAQEPDRAPVREPGREPAPADASTGALLVGNWSGALDLGEVRLRIVFHVTATEDGLAATLDSPDQGAYGIPVSEVRVDGDSVELLVGAVAGRFAGRYDPGRDGIAGTWSQGGAGLPLGLERSDDAGPRRPQEPEEPLPYEARDVRFRNAEAGIELAGTLTFPSGGGPHPAVVLVSGSGPQDRDESVFGHRPFLVLADYLTRRGIAVLRYDDRGVAGSEGDFAAATTLDFASDADVAVRWLAERPEVDPSRVGVVGHSEGALVAPMLASGESPVAFVVLLAGPGLPGEELLYAQGEAVIRANGGDDGAVTRERDVQERMFAVVRGEPDSAGSRERLLEILDEAGLHGTAAEAQVRAVLSPWMRFFLSYDPRADLERLRVPVLALIGGRDTQVPPGANLAELRAALARGGNPDATVRELPGLNHLFQEAVTGSPAEYGTIEETMAPSALAAVGDWIEARVR